MATQLDILELHRLPRTAVRQRHARPQLLTPVLRCLVFLVGCDLRGFTMGVLMDDPLRYGNAD